MFTCPPTATPAAAAPDQYDQYLLVLPSGLTVFLSPPVPRLAVTVGDLLQELTKKTHIALDSSQSEGFVMHRLVFQGRILSDPKQTLEDAKIQPRPSRSSANIVAPDVIELVCVGVIGERALSCTPLTDTCFFLCVLGRYIHRVPWQHMPRHGTIASLNARRPFKASRKQPAKQRKKYTPR